VRNLIQVRRGGRACRGRRRRASRCPARPAIATSHGDAMSPLSGS